MVVIKCYKCKCATKKVSKVSELFSNKYLLSDITYHQCDKCGEKYFDLNEYEKIRKKIAAIESETPQKVLAQAKVVVL